VTGHRSRRRHDIRRTGRRPDPRVRITRHYGKFRSQVRQLPEFSNNCTLLLSLKKFHAGSWTGAMFTLMAVVPRRPMVVNSIQHWRNSTAWLRSISTSRRHGTHFILPPRATGAQPHDIALSALPCVTLRNFRHRCSVPRGARVHEYCASDTQTAAPSRITRRAQRAAQDCRPPPGPTARSISCCKPVLQRREPRRFRCLPLPGPRHAHY
jgi:hypothetical protein